MNHDDVNSASDTLLGRASEGTVGESISDRNRPWPALASWVPAMGE